jgi:hypothetical protein
MKLVLVLIGICVAVATAAGYWVGSELLGNPLYETIIAHVVIAPAESGKFALNYICDGKVLASYDVDSEKIVSPALSPEDIVTLNAESQKTNPVLYRRVYDGVIGFVTGGGAVRFARPVITILKSRGKDRHTIPSVIGALSGFYLGYAAATRHVPHCDNALAILTTQSPKAWKVLKGLIASRYLTQVMLLSKAPESSIAEATKMIANKQVNSQTFAILASIDKYVPPEVQQSSWYSLSTIMEVYFPALVLCCLAVGVATLLLHRSARLASAREARLASARKAQNTEKKLRDN